MSDRIFGAFGLGLAIFYAWATLQIQESFLSDTVGPKAFPLIVAAILGLASLVILLRPDSAPQWPAPGRLAEIAAAAVVMILYAEFLPKVGFVFATALAAAYLSWRLGSTVVQSVIAGIGISIGIYVVFHLLFGLSLARGPFGF
ncbi:MAG: tripartite tricarboxylate transporter TctB family protein [Rhodobacter sp.]|uniref:tripartite tricarboxylate transporter TctB family protein n=1 Tax=Pararhodobacter sp. TaxID=2127056 RepID=UPI001D47E877|nr:tripartite tricarboxylate transporter TctB family protein [Pararhodobacter sp.]MCB1345161.1 tripartite tricarboxylate transporter TctB family protein [Paracoccaceae bacterium]MCC0071771.1 tripartite tricarboxylate transporter TctB family protein [Rhodobacter sp.]HPD91059.1 tripartite tricarboxylate transporter TctB family protein [Pararhodobacter sp.]